MSKQRLRPTLTNDQIAGMIWPILPRTSRHQWRKAAAAADCTCTGRTLFTIWLSAEHDQEIEAIAVKTGIPLPPPLEDHTTERNHRPLIFFPPKPKPPKKT